MLESLLNNNCFKKSLQRRCFHVNIANILRTTFFIKHLRWLLLHIKTRVPQGSIFGPIRLLQYTWKLSDDIICNTFQTKFDQASFLGIEMQVFNL